MERGLLGQWQRISSLGFVMRAAAELEAAAELCSAPHSLCLLQRLGIGFVFRALAVQQGYQVAGCGWSFYFAAADNVFRAEFLSVKFFVGASVRAQCRAFQRDPGKQA